MAKKTEFTVDDAAAEVVSAFEKFMQVLTKNGGVVSSQVEEEVEADEEEELEAPDREEVESLGIKELRELAKQYGIDATKKADILAEFEDLYDEEDDEDEDDEEEEEEADEDDEDEEEEDDEDEEDELDRETLEELDLKALRKIAKENGHSASDYKGMDQDALIDLILGEEDEDDEDEEDDVEELDEDALAAMSHKELVALADELNIKVPKPIQKNTKANQKKLVELILDSGDDE